MLQAIRPSDPLSADMATRVDPGPVAAMPAGAAATRPVLFVASDEARAATVAAMLAAFAPGRCVVHLPASDAWPGDDAPPPPAHAGQRVAALRRLRRMQATGERVVCVTTAEATASCLAAPADFDIAPPVLRVRDAIDAAAFADRAVEPGYIVAERIDDPAERLAKVRDVLAAIG